MAVRKLIPYAGYEHPKHTTHRKVPVGRAIELRAEGKGWKIVAWELTLEYDTEMPFTADGVQAAVARASRRETA